jgi:hypothetical protein
MPTAAKLVAAICFAAIGWLAANAHIPALGENAAYGLFREITAVIGALVGWLVMGGLVGQNYGEAAGSGLRTSVTLVFFALLVFSTYGMLQNASKMVYDGPMDAVLAIFQLMMENGREMLTVGVLTLLIGGGMLGGVVTEWSSRRWR